MTDVKPIPDGYPRVTPSLAIDGASAAIDFYTKVLGATEQPGRWDCCGEQASPSQSFVRYPPSCGSRFHP
jgi:hypothetical protein